MMRPVRYVALLGMLLVALPTVSAHAAAGTGGPQTICIKVNANIKPRPVHVGDFPFLHRRLEELRAITLHPVRVRSARS